MTGGSVEPDHGPPPSTADAHAGEIERWLRCEHVWTGAHVRDDVHLGIGGDRIVAIVSGDPRDSDGPDPGGVPVERVRGLVLPGLVDAHSHAFHRALRGRTHDDGGSFWTWRERMYEVAAVLDPDLLHALARALFAEQLQAGITTIGEFHYLHHGPGGAPYVEPNATGRALLAAADEAGIRITLLDALYLTGDLGRTSEDPGLDPVQRRFSDGSPGTWAERVQLLAATVADRPLAHVGAAFHSVRAVPPAAAEAAVTLLDDALGPAATDARTPVLHAHVAEQRREVARSREVHGRSPVGLLDEAGALASSFTAVHGVWLDDEDVATLAAHGATVCACPTTERDLADGVVAVEVLVEAGVGLALGSDQHVACDLFEEARGLELDRRLVTGRRGLVDPSRLLHAATTGGAHSLGWRDAGTIAVGALADLCVVGLGSTRLAGVAGDRLVDGVVFAATAEDVSRTMVGGRWVVADGRHVDLDAAAALRRAIADVDAAIGPTP